ncbi:Outer membrane receptor protein [Erythrobacter litoralis]|jgi:outer membrane receptor protein involved in Fe transport|uniref:TonB-dependent receptor n=1 Tax=Erythrobacter TaxID=1041 RepID=UPI0005573973|nr:TonB-dependent receptor [Erythrobacter litoralis]AOL24616.1 Outer membrane receptor protein [Erythrobacter litoralis]MEE4337678.1 TonB-dependent receptor [Erythrobacter sp.]
MKTASALAPLLALSVSLFALGVAAPVSAQEEDDASQRPTAERIIVTGEGLEEAPSEGAYAVTEIDRERIVSTASGRIEDVLRDVAGFQQFRRSDSRSANPTAQGATLRALGGNATSRALVLLDGVPIADPFFGYVPFNAIQPETLSRIRVTRGGGAGPFGAGALAGTIELESAGPAALDPLLASLVVNDREETEASAVLTQELGAGFAVASGRWDRGQGFFTAPAGERIPASARAGFDNWQVGLRGVAPIGRDVEVQARVSLFEDNRTLRFEGADSSNEGQDASLRVVGRGEWAFDALAYVQARNFSNVIISSTQFSRVLDQRNTPSTGLGGKFELRPPVGEAHTLRLGVDYRRADGELQEDNYSAFTGALRERRRAGGVNSNLGFFIEDDWRIGRLLLTGGLRADRTVIEDGFFRAVDASGALVEETLAQDRSDWTLSWRAGAAFEASDALRLRAAAYTGLRLPTLNELYRPFVVFPVVTQANAALENERLEGFEIGVDWQASDALALSLTAFDNRVENAIANVTLAPNLRQRRNLPAIDAQGIEGNVRLGLGRVSLDASLAYTDAAVDGEGPSLPLDGNRPPQTPDFAASATLAWEPSAGWRLAATLRHTAKQFEDDQENDVLPAATTLDAFAEIPVGADFSLMLRGENLTGEEIVTRNAGGAIDLGVPRTVWAGLRYGF